MNKRKRDKELEEEQSSFSDLDPNIKKTIFAIVLLTLTIVLVLSFFGLAGGGGDLLTKITSKIIGNGRFFLPIGLLILSITYFKRLKGKTYLTLWVGLMLIVLGMLGLMHIFYEGEEMKEVIRAGGGGGFIGFFLASIALKTVGIYAGSIILVAFVIVGILMTFNSYLAKIFQRDDESSTLALKDDLDDRVEIRNEKLNLFAKIKGAVEQRKKKHEDVSKDNETETDKNSETLQAGESSNKAVLKTTENKNIVSNWKLPPISLLEKIVGKPQGGNVEKNAAIIEKTLDSFGIDAEVIDIKVGPTVTQYAVHPSEGVKIAKIVALQNDLSMALAAHPIRVEAPIPGKSLVGIEIPNKKFALVHLRNLMEDAHFFQKGKLMIGLGADTAGHNVYANLADMPHLLVAGSTGAGKSIGITCLINSLLFQYSPDDLKLILVDPKRVELSVYNDIPHLLTPVIVDLDKVVNALKWVIAEMERRYQILQESETRDLQTYNQKIEKEGVKVNIKVKEEGINSDEAKDADTAPSEETGKLPFIVIVIDEMADLMISHGKDMEALIVRIAQKARAVGIHLVLSTQRPSVEIITGLIKANIPSRIAFQIASQVDSRTILDMAGAEKLLGKGDMLYLAREASQPKRIQGSYIKDGEVKKVVNFLKKQSVADYDEEIVQARSLSDFQSIGLSGGIPEGKNGGDDYNDELFQPAKEVVIENRKASATLLQRKLRVGYARAARLIEMLEEEGIIGPYNGAKPREILASKEEETDYQDDMSDQGKRDNWNA
ncbi:MAG: DNA translocase FtsK 4TM domain-containing protein [Patescibacteria group bacterium]|nr:DNA translocase FtsK 4TM domain-containing protein [Patescibacteria group bacterium]